MNSEGVSRVAAIPPPTGLGEVDSCSVMPTAQNWSICEPRDNATESSRLTESSMTARDARRPPSEDDSIGKDARKDFYTVSITLMRWVVEEGC